MHGTDEVRVAGKEETAIAFGEFGHGGFVGFWSGFSLPKIGVLVARNHDCSLRDFTTNPL